MLTLFLALAADPVVLSSKIQDVTLYAQTALVHRSADVGGPGVFVIQGLPLTMDPSNVRVRLSRGDVVNVEVRERQQSKVENERVQALRERLKVAQREMRMAEDDLSVLTSMGKHLQRLLELSGDTQSRDVQQGKASPESWDASFAYLQRKIAETTSAVRESGWKLQERGQAVAELERELGSLANAGSTTVRDVVVDIVTPAAATLDLEYLVSGTGWQPMYDLRTARDLSKVDLNYRARIWQQSGEDWNDVELMLSTAQPQRGAQGREPEAVWLSVESHERVMSTATPSSRPVRNRKDEEDKAVGRGYAASDRAPAESPPPFATVESQGLSVRYKLARRETVESRSQPTTVLVGSAALEVAAERFCAPALDTTVWLRGRTKNTSAWTILPGPATVFLGADYLGQAQLELVQPGQEFTLHLGADPSIVVTRTRTDDLEKGPGFLSSRVSKLDGWRTRLENHGAVSRNAEGSVDVIVRESLPRSRDERIEVSVTKCEPRIANDERWKKDLEEKGIQTWIVKVPKGGATDVVLQTTTTFPKGVDVVRD